MVETCHNVWFDPSVHKIYHPDAYAFCTPYHKEKTFADVSSYGEVLEFPIEKMFRTNEEQLIAQKKLDIDINKIHVINVGLWTSGKNQKEGVEIARLLEKSEKYQQKISTICWVKISILINRLYVIYNICPSRC